MKPLTGETDVFSVSGDDRCGVVFLARRRPVREGIRTKAAADVMTALRRLAQEGWQLSVGEMFGEHDEPAAYDAGFAHDIDVVGIFDAPNMTAALAGSVDLELAGWDLLFHTEWLIGPREFGAILGSRGRDNEWGFVALWEWNDAWQAASDEQRREYDIECDVAFTADLRAGVNIAGRHRMDWASNWHHVGVWEVSDLAVLDTAMREHERVADFKFTTSRHYVGRLRTIADLLKG